MFVSKHLILIDPSTDKSYIHKVRLIVGSPLQLLSENSPAPTLGFTRKAVFREDIWPGEPSGRHVCHLATDRG